MVLGSKLIKGMVSQENLSNETTKKGCIFSDSKSCLSGLNWPCSGKNTHFLALFWLVEGTLGIG